jgi:hypothetical protein
MPALIYRKWQPQRCHAARAGQQRLDGLAAAHRPSLAKTSLHVFDKLATV